MKARTAVVADSPRQDFLNVMASYERAVATIKEQQEQIARLTAQRDGAQSYVDTLTFDLDKTKEKLAKAQEQILHEQDMSRQNMKRVLNLKQQTQKLSAIIRCALSPEKYHEAHSFAKEQYPHLWKEQA